MAKSKKTKRGVMMMTDDEMDINPRYAGYDAHMGKGKKKKGKKKS